MMDPSTPLSPEIVAKIDALAKQISVAEHLDAEIQAELRGHVEDKVRGYLSGEVRVSEGDAMILAKAHFGDAQVVKAMFQGVHRVEHATSLGRKLVAAFVATQIVSAVLAVVDVLFRKLFGYHIAVLQGAHAIYPQAPYHSATAGILVLEAALLWAIFFYWRWRQSRGRRMWFERWNPVALAAVVLGVVVGLLSLDWGIHQSSWYISYQLMPTLTYKMVVISWVWECVSRGTQAALWIWWCDGAPRTRRTLLYAMVCWIAATRLLGACFVTVAICAERREISWYIISGFIPALLSSMSLNMKVEALVGVLALVLYMEVTRRRSAVMVA